MPDLLKPLGNNRSQYLVLIIALLTVIANHYFAYIGHYGYDDMNYARIAVNLNRGIIDYTDHFTYRFPLVVLTAISYKIFGVNDFASSLPPMLITFLIVGIVFSVLRKKSLSVLIIGLGLTLFNQWFLFYTDKLMPDIYVALAVIFSLFIIYRYKYESDKSKPWFYAFFLSAGLLFGFVSKGTIILVIPLFLYLFVLDLCLKRDLKFWFNSIAFGALMLLTYFLLLKYLTGNSFQRFDALLDNSYLNRCSYDKQSIDLLFERIAYRFFILFVSTGLFTGMAFVIAALFQKNIKTIFKLETPFSFFLVSALLLFLSANFMSISLTGYVPMCIDQRHYLFIVPVAAIPAAQIVISFFKKKKLALQILLVFFLLAFSSKFMEGTTFGDIYLPLFILLALAYFVQHKIKNKGIFVFLFVAILMVYPMNMVKYAQQLKYPQQREFVYENLIQTQQKAYVISNDVQKRLGDYYTGFKAESPVFFLSYNKFNPDTLKKDYKIYLLTNKYTQNLSGLNQNDLPFYAKKPENYGSLFKENKTLKIQLFALPELHNPYSKSNLLFDSFNGFEKPRNYWMQDSESISGELKYEGKTASKVDEYSATFNFPLDSLYQDSLEGILISAEVYCNFAEATKAKLVISTESKNGEKTWQAMEINKYLKAYSNWWPVNFELILTTEEIPPGTVLKIYVWNTEKMPAYIDNFRIKIYRL